MVSTYPGTKTWSAGNLSSSDMNQYVRDIILWGFEERPRVWVSRTEAQSTMSISNDSDTEVVWGETATGWETPSTWWTSGTDLTVPVDGIYLIQSRLRYESNTSGYRQVRHNVNGSFRNVVSVGPSAAGDTPFMPMSTIEPLNSGDTVTLSAYQNSGGALEVGNSVGSSHSLGMQILYLMEG